VRRSSAILVVLLALSGCGSEDSESVRGTGYQFELPAGWEERTDDEALEDFDFAGYQFDTVATGEVEEGFATNVNVIVEGSVAPGVSTREYAEASERTLRNPGLIQGDAGQAV